LDDEEAEAMNERVAKALPLRAPAAEGEFSEGVVK
jgi:hypothetical protein